MIGPRRFAILIGALAVLGAPASAQFITTNGQYVGLLSRPDVQEELGLDRDQIEQARKATESARERWERSAQETKGLKPRERIEAIQARRKDLADAYDKEIAGFLKPEQLKRLREITLQRRGGEAFQDAAVRDALKLTEEQRARIDGMLRHAQQEVREALDVLRDRPYAREMLDKRAASIKRELIEGILAALTVEQKQAWKTMIGEPSEVAEPIPE